MPALDIAALDISNQCMVGVAGESIRIMRPIRVMTRIDALILAAWLVAVADEHGDFPEVLAKVQGT